MRILGLDPGTTNFAFAVTEVNGNKFKPIIAGKVQNRVRDMAHVRSECVAFHAEMLSLIKEHKPDHIIVERFMNRGRFSGATGEYVSMMIGLVVLMAHELDIDVYIVNPATWKNAVSRALDKKGSKVKRLDKMYAYTLAEPHELDAYLMTHYRFCLTNGITPFSHLVGAQGSKKFIHDFESVATGKKKRKRKVV